MFLSVRVKWLASLLSAAVYQRLTVNLSALICTDKEDHDGSSNCRATDLLSDDSDTAFAESVPGKLVSVCFL